MEHRRQHEHGVGMEGCTQGVHVQVGMSRCTCPGRYVQVGQSMSVSVGQSMSVSVSPC